MLRAAIGILDGRLRPPKGDRTKTRIGRAGTDAKITTEPPECQARRNNARRGRGRSGKHDRTADCSPVATDPPTDPERKHEKGWGTADGEAERHRQQNGARRNTDRAGGCGRANTSGTADTHRTGDDDPGGPRGTAAVRISDRPRQKKPNDLFNIMPLW